MDRSGYKKILTKTLIAATLLSMVNISPVFGGTYTFQQTDWSGGATTTSAIHPANQIEWNKYSSSTGGINAGATITVRTPNTIIQTTDTDFNAGTTATTTLNMWTGASSSVVMSGALTPSPWSLLTSSTAGISGGLAYPGSGDYIFALRSNWNKIFYKYSISQDSWSSASSSPISLTTINTPMVGTPNYIFAGITGSSTLMQYTIATDQWSIKTSAPGTFTQSYGSSFAYDGGNYIYAIRGGISGNSTTSLYRYYIPGDSWETMADAPAYLFGTKNAVSVGDNFYILQGNSSSTFLRYASSTNTWSYLDNGIGSNYGSPLVYPGTGDFIYAFTGNGYNVAKKYSISDNTWTNIVATQGNNATADSWVSDGTYIYKTTQSSGTFRRLNPALDTGWTQLSSVNATTTSSVTALLTAVSTSTLYAVGYTGSLFKKYDVPTDTWTNASSSSSMGTVTYAGGDFIYGLDYSGSNRMLKYSISNNTWTNTGTTLPVTNSYGLSILYPGSGDTIYIAGPATSTLFGYSIANNTYTSLTPTTMTGSNSMTYTGGDYIYLLNGGTSSTLRRYSISENSWTILSAAPTSFSPSALVYPGSGGYLYAAGGNSNAVWRYSINEDSWTSMPGFPISTSGKGQSLTYPGTGAYIYALPGDGTFYKFQTITYSTTGTFTSTAINMETGISTGTISWSNPMGQTITMKARSSNNSGMSGATDWDSCSNIASGGTLSSGECFSSGNQYIQYQATLGTADTTASPSLDSVTISPGGTSGTLTSSPYDSSSTINAVTGLSWDEQTAANSTTTISIRTASSSAGLTGSWTDFTNASANCSKAGNTVTCTSAAIPSSSNDGLNDQWFDYKITLEGTSEAPTTTAVRITYAQNFAPDFNSNFGTNGIAVNQVATSTDANWGKVNIQYSIMDTDATSGTVTPGYITPSFAYNIGAGWVTISSSTLAEGDTSNKAVLSTSYTTHTATWTPTAGIYATGTQMRITASDNEPINSTASTSFTFSLDSAAPTLSQFLLNISSSTITLNTSDNSEIQYRLGNNPLGEADLWTNVDDISTSTTFTFAFTSSTYPTAYLQVRDALGNQTTSTISAPYAPLDFQFKDTSNVGNNSWSEFLTWETYQATGTAAFASYKIYRSSDSGATYSLLTTISNSTTTYYIDTGLSSSTTYYYKMTTDTPNGDISQYSTTISDKPDGQGGTDSTTPTISAITTSNIDSTGASITWTTDELSNGEIGYSVSPSAAFGETAAQSDYLTSHRVDIAGLNASTTYLFRVKSTDPSGNIATANNNGAGYSFATLNTPVISNVTTEQVTDTSAQIFWNTNVSSNSRVVYGTSSILASPQETSDSSMVAEASGGIFQHRVALSNLSAGNTYYFYVQSTDAQSITATNNNSGNYYQFVTTRDAKAPVISNIQVPVKSSTAAVITWQTDEPGTSRVYYGAASAGTTPYSASTNLDSTLTVSHVVTLSNLNAETKYYYQIQSQDSAGNSISSTEQNFTTPISNIVFILSSGGGSPPPPSKDTAPPAISNIKVEKITAFTATVNFETSESTTSFIEYGETADYGSAGAQAAAAKKHSIRLSGLKFGTIYHFKIQAIDGEGNSSYSKDETFKTKFFAESIKDIKEISADESPQKLIEDSIESILPSLAPPFIEKIDIADITESSAVIRWKTNIKSYSVVSYVPEESYDSQKENPYTAETSDMEKKTINHELKLNGLNPNTRYNFVVKSFSLPQVIGKSENKTFLTRTALIKPRITETKNDALRISWITDEPASSITTYKNLRTGEIRQKTDPAKIKEHNILIENLAPGTSYEIKASGYNEKDNLIETGEAITAKTSQDLTAPQITNIKIDNALVPGRKDKVQTIISWKTSEPATSLAYYQSGNNIKKDEFLEARIPSLVTDHNIILTDLKPGLLYRVKIESIDEAGNKTQTPIRTIVTPRQSESIVDIVIKNFEETFNFLEKIR